MQAEDLYDSIRAGLITMLPRLKRFADLLAGERRVGEALLRRALRRMLAEEHHYQRGTALDRWAFAEIYQLWLEDLRDHTDLVGQAKVSDASFARLFCTGERTAFDAVTVSFLRSLPPQQRLTLLLVYGERFGHSDAASVLDVTAETISARLVRVTADLADRLSTHMPATQDTTGGASEGMAA